MSAPAAAPDVAAEIGRWLAYLGAERRMSAKTLEAYHRDVGQFLEFLAGHLGGAPTRSSASEMRLAVAMVSGFGKVFATLGARTADKAPTLLLPLRSR